MYKISFTSPTGSIIEMEVSEEIYALFEAERKYHQRVAKEHDRHIDDRHIEDFRHRNVAVDWSAYAGQLEEKEMLETLVKILKEHCTEKQARRFLLYFDGYKLSEIAKMEGCAESSVSISIKAVREKINKFYKFLKTI